MEAIGRSARVLAGALFMAFLISTDATSASAQISISDSFNFSDTYGVNPVGNGAPIGSTGFYQGGTYDSVGADSVTPSAATTVTATQGVVTYSLNFIGGPGTALPDQFYANLPLDPSLTGSWTLTATNPSEPIGAVVQTPTLNVLNTPPPVTGVTLSGDGLAPTVTWSVPSSSSATTETVFVFQAGVPAHVFGSANLAAGTSSYTLPTGVLTAGDLYSIAVQEDVRPNGVTGDLESRSRSFTAYFAPTSGTINGSIVLPTVSSTLSQYGGPTFEFDTPVTEGAPISIDPPSAEGFIYKIGTGDPNFASVELPDVGNPSPYDLYLWNGSAFVFDTTVNPDTVFDFSAGGVSEFEILGIASSIGLNPNSATDFVTQLTFEGSGTFTGTMTPVIGVPEPSTWAMMLLGFAGLGFLTYWNPRRSVSIAV
jgi:PEP-CTERM motif